MMIDSGTGAEMTTVQWKANAPEYLFEAAEYRVEDADLKHARWTITLDKGIRFFVDGVENGKQFKSQTKQVKIDKYGQVDTSLGLEQECFCQVQVESADKENVTLMNGIKFPNPKSVPFLSRGDRSNGELDSKAKEELEQSLLRFGLKADQDYALLAVASATQYRGGKRKFNVRFRSVAEAIKVEKACTFKLAVHGLNFRPYGNRKFCVHETSATTITEALLQEADRTGARVRPVALPGITRWAARWTTASSSAYPRPSSCCVRASRAWLPLH